MRVDILEVTVPIDGMLAQVDDVVLDIKTKFPPEYTYEQKVGPPGGPAPCV